MTSSIVIERQDNIVLVRLNRPEALNALNHQVMTELCDALEPLDRDRNIGCFVLTGNEKAFAAGADIKEMAEQSYMDVFHGNLFAGWDRFVQLRTPRIAAVNGYALGGGCELVAMLDFAYASTTARFAQTEVRLGIIPGAGGSQNLVRAIGLKRAKQLILTGETFSAEQAYNWGLINQLCAPEQLMDEVTEVARQIARNAPIAVRQSKMAVSRAPDLSLADGLMFEIEAYNRCVTTKDRREGLKAFNEKRRPEFTGQ